MVDLYKNALRKTNFPNYEYFEDVSRAYSVFFQKLTAVISNAAPSITKLIKENPPNWFDGEVLEKLSSKNKLFKNSRE